MKYTITLIIPYFYVFGYTNEKPNIKKKLKTFTKKKFSHFWPIIRDIPFLSSKGLLHHHICHYESLELNTIGSKYLGSFDTNIF